MVLQQLTLRANRYLAVALLENRLITNQDVENANAKFLSLLQSGNSIAACVLTILIYDLKALDEHKMIEKLVEKYQVGLMHLGHFKPENAPLDQVTNEECRATMSLPFDRIGNAVCIATCYYLSKPVIDYWESKFESVLWYSTSVNSMTIALDSLPIPEPEAKTED